MSNKEDIQYRKTKGIGWIVLNRPEAMNALNKDVLQQVESILDAARVDDAIRAIVITGAGDKAFSAGADIKLLNQFPPLEVRKFSKLAVAVNHKIETSEKVVVAAINGYALGGGLELAEACMLSPGLAEPSQT